MTASAAKTGVTPNLYSLSGNGVHVTYASTGIDGRPSLEYQDAFQSQQFRGDDLRVAEGDLGGTVTVWLRRTVDSGSTSFTLLVPNAVAPQWETVQIETVGVTAIHRFSVLRLTGQLTTYESILLHGVAEAVDF